jgi:hypothetical protein
MIFTLSFFNPFVFNPLPLFFGFLLIKAIFTWLLANGKGSKQVMISRMCETPKACVGGLWLQIQLG